MSATRACSCSARTWRRSAGGASARRPRRCARRRIASSGWLRTGSVPGGQARPSAIQVPLDNFVRKPPTRGVTMADKMWGDEPYWGLGYDWDPDWFLTERQKDLRAKLIDLCEGEMRANAKRSDDELLYPRRNFEILAENGFLGLTVPEEYGGLGANQVA